MNEHYYEIKNISYDVIEVTPKMVCEELEEHRFVDMWGDSWNCAWGIIAEDNTIILIQKKNSGKIILMRYNADDDEDIDERVLSNKFELLELLNEMVYKDRNIIFEHYLIVREIDINDKFDELLDMLIDAKEKEIPWMRVHE